MGKVDSGAPFRGQERGMGHRIIYLRALLTDQPSHRPTIHPSIHPMVGQSEYQERLGKIGHSVRSFRPSVRRATSGEGGTNVCTDIWTDIRTVEHMDGRTDGRMDGCTDGHMDRGTDGCTDGMNIQM
jgi:hypothetical protein